MAYAHFRGNTQLFAHEGVVAGTTTGTIVTANATLDTKGAWTQLSASTPMAANGAWLMLGHGDGGTGQEQFLIDIGFGSTTVVIAPDIFWPGIKAVATGLGPSVGWIPLPIHIPAGTDVRMRVQSSLGSAVVLASLLLAANGVGPSAPFQRLASYGSVSSGSRGTDADPGAVANTKATSWSQLDAAIANPIRWMYVLVGNSDNWGMSSATRWHLDIGIGASSSEKILIPDLITLAGNTGDTVIPGSFGPFEVHIPAGTRLSARCQCNITNSTDRIIDVSILGAD
jgi:hypothetical protein